MKDKPEPSFQEMNRLMCKAENEYQKKIDALRRTIHEQSQIISRLTETTSGPWYAIEYAGYWDIQSVNGYGEYGVLNEDQDKNAEANARLAARAPELLIENQSLQARILELENRNAELEKDIKYADGDQ